jgi:hypothetical protein
MPHEFMGMPRMTARERREFTGRSMLRSAFCLLFPFLVLPYASLRDRDQGWNFLWDIVGLIFNPQMFLDVTRGSWFFSFYIASFLVWLFLCGVSPWIIPLFLQSRIVWQTAMVLSLPMFLTNFIGFASFSGRDFAPGAFCLMLSSSLHFIGLLVLRDGKRRRRSLSHLPHACED